jgi:hypothetical protein
MCCKRPARVSAACERADKAWIMSLSALTARRHANVEVDDWGMFIVL